MQKDSRNLGHKQRSVLKMLKGKQSEEFFRPVKKEMTVSEITAAFGYVCYRVFIKDVVCTNGEDYKRLHSLQRRGLINRVPNKKVQTYTLS